KISFSLIIIFGIIFQTLHSFSSALFVRCYPFADSLRIANFYNLGIVVSFNCKFKMNFVFYSINQFFDLNWHGLHFVACKNAILLGSVNMRMKEDEKCIL